jgi:hypothetical protein
VQLRLIANFKRPTDRYGFNTPHQVDAHIGLRRDVGDCLGAFDVLSRALMREVDSRSARNDSAREMTLFAIFALALDTMAPGPYGPPEPGRSFKLPWQL